MKKGIYLDIYSKVKSNSKKTAIDAVIYLGLFSALAFVSGPQQAFYYLIALLVVIATVLLLLDLMQLQKGIQKLSVYLVFHFVSFALLQLLAHQLFSFERHSIMLGTGMFIFFISMLAGFSLGKGNSAK